MTYRKVIRLGCALGALYGACWAAMALSAAWSLNPQEEFRGDGAGLSSLVHLIEIGLSWLLVKGVPVAAFVCAAGCGLLASARALSRSRPGPFGR